MPAGSNQSILSGGKNIFLIGFMGSGKTHWGRIWAEKYQLNFVDLDELIEERQGTSVAHIFDTNGEEHFRLLEKDALHSCEKLEHSIIACGGGTPCFFDNLDWMNQQGFTIFLSCEPPEILRRVSLEKDKRPLFSKLNPEEFLDFIRAKLAERQPFYDRAKYHLTPAELNDTSLEQFI
ncbi:MAG: shikimate kinase [Ferruginibacter sp.]|nr:shikimate kinase [Ferruginibacter sp.]